VFAVAKMRVVKDMSKHLHKRWRLDNYTDQTITLDKFDTKEKEDEYHREMEILEKESIKEEKALAVSKFKIQPYYQFESSEEKISEIIASKKKKVDRSKTKKTDDSQEIDDNEDTREREDRVKSLDRIINFKVKGDTERRPRKSKETAAELTLTVDKKIRR